MNTRSLTFAIAIGLLLVPSVAAQTPVAATPVASPSTAPGRPPCVFDSRFGSGYEPCAPFTRVHAHALATFTSSVFGDWFGEARRPVVALNDGSAMVEAGSGGLYRIDNQNHVAVLWLPDEHDWYGDPIELLAPFSGGAVVYAAKSVLGVRVDGSVVFRKQIENADKNWLGFRVTASQDAKGIVWFSDGNWSKTSVYAYLPHARKIVTLPSVLAQGQIIAAPDGRVYENGHDGLFSLTSAPQVHSRFVHSPISLPPRPADQFGIDTFSSSADIQAVGSDGSLWGSTYTQVIHVHPDGSIHTIRLAPPITAIKMPPINFHLTMARDGSVWLPGKLVRITNDDRVQAIDLPHADGWRLGPSFGPDNTAWAITTGEDGGSSENVVHFSISPLASRQSSVVITKKAEALPGPTRGPLGIAVRRSPPRHPVPRVVPPPPRSGGVQFVYVTNSGSSSVSAFWVKDEGKLVPVRGSPFATGSTPESLTIDPAGKFLYVRDSLTEIYGYKIDSATGALTPVPGSPFTAERGPGTIVIDAADKVAYANNVNSDNVSAYTIDANRGTLVPLAGSPFATGGAVSIALNPRRKIAYVVTDSSIETFSTVGDGLRQIAKAQKHDRFSTDMVVDHEGKFIYLGNGWRRKISIYRIGATLGEPELLSGSTVRAGWDPRGILINAKGNILYVCNFARPHGSVSGYAVDSKTGTLKPLSWSPFNGVEGPQNIAIVPSVRFMYATDWESMSVSGLAIDPVNGSLKLIQGSPFPTGGFPWGVTTCRRSGNACRPSPR